MKPSYNLSVTFGGWKNVPPPCDAERAALHNRYGLRQVQEEVFRSGECALLEVANNDTRELRFNALAVEYKAEGAWQYVVPKNWPWFSGSRWFPGTRKAIPVPRPAEVPRDAPWRIQFECCPEGEADDRHKVRMETPEIPPMGRTGE
jgi:hypothetical protein